MPSVIVTESTLRLVFGGIALETAGFSHFEGPLSSAFIRAEATFAGLLSAGQIDRVRDQRPAVPDEIEIVGLIEGVEGELRDHQSRRRVVDPPLAVLLAQSEVPLQARWSRASVGAVRPK